MVEVNLPVASKPLNVWLLTFIIMVGTVAAIMGASTINVSLPDIMSGLGVSQDQISWVSTAYMLANVISIPTAAWLGSLLSKRLVFGLGLCGFLLGSILCGISWDFSSMIAFRVVQGLSAGLVMPTAQALLFEAFPPHKRGLAMGVYGLGAIMGPAIGPTLGGYLAAAINWRAIFFVNAPFAITSLALLSLLPSEERRKGLKFDTLGFVSLALCLSTLLIALTNGAKDGWTAPYIVACFALSLVSGSFLLLHETTTPQPMLDFEVFSHPTYNGATIVSLIVGLGLYGSTFIVPLYLGNLLGYSALDIGLIMLPGSLVMGVMMLLAGRLSDWIDVRILLGVGLCLFAYFLYLASRADADSTTAYFVWALVWRGLGMGMVFSPLSAVALGGVPPKLLSQASGMFNLTRQLAGTVGIAFLSTTLTTRITFHMAMISQRMLLNSNQTQRFLGAGRQLFLSHGYSPTSASQGAFMLLGKAVMRQVASQAYQDLFLICVAVTLCGLVPTLFMRVQKVRKAT